MQITINTGTANTKTIPDLLEEMGYSLPCNCHGGHHCDGKNYPFDCSLVPKEPMTISLPDSPQKTLQGIALEDRITVPGPADTLLIDLGTTTIALALIDRSTGDVRQTLVFPNPQRQYGSDVIARIHASLHGKRSQLKHMVTEALTHQVSALCQKNHQSLSGLSRCFIAGNTAMIHLLMGYDCTPLSRSPFLLEQASPGPFYYKDCKIYVLPWFSAFVGGDITAGMYACHMEVSPSCGKAASLLIDLGTNGEMLLCHKGCYYSTATAAGPAFEGNGLSCGCPGIPGAISRVRLMPLRPALTTIDHRLPVGLCGSGAISICAELLRQGYVTKEGILTDRFPAGGILLGYSPSRTALYFLPEDFRHIQLSVAAIAAGIDTLAREADISPADISSVYLGGGFGFYLEPDACERLGLFSSIPASHIRPMGNTCLRGLFRYACHTEDTPLPSPPSTHIVSLADYPYFQKQFISHMTYPGKPGDPM